MPTEPPTCAHCAGKRFGCPHCSYVNLPRPPELTGNVVEEVLLNLHRQIEEKTAQRIAAFFDGDSDGWIREIILSGRWRPSS